MDGIVSENISVDHNNKYNRISLIFKSQNVCNHWYFGKKKFFPEIFSFVFLTLQTVPL